jgi:hypothetical protein
MLDDPIGWIAGPFSQVEPRRRARSLVLGCWLTYRARTTGASPSTLGTQPLSGGRWVSAAGMAALNSSANADESNVKSISRDWEAIRGAR